MDAPSPELTARLAAARVLVALERGRTTLADEIERDRRDLPDARDRGLFLEITTGTLRWQGALDAELARFSRTPLMKLAPEVRAVLRLGAYQLLHLDRVPIHAVVHESVETTKQMGVARAAGFVNAVLRSLVRSRSAPAPSGRGKPSLPTKPDDVSDREAALAYLSVTLSHPRWLVERWLDRHGFEATEAWCRFNNAAPWIGVRPRTGSRAELLTRLRGAGIEAEPSSISRTAIRLPPGALGRLGDELREAIVVQDEGAQFVAESTGAAGGERVLDPCAAPGGKTQWLREAVGAGGIVVACDYRPKRVALLARQVSGPIVRLDAASPLPFAPVFDHVLLDAPCSGLGTLRRDPDLKWSRRPDDLTRLAREQRRMIAAAAGVVRPGGTLTYATCSSEPEENEDVVAHFLGEHSGFTLSREHHTWPFADGTDAFYAAQLRRVEPA
jgi:16S rRNA (cytosine967-C5)-methyltransferase